MHLQERKSVGLRCTGDEHYWEKESVEISLRQLLECRLDG